jgi:hypothetical protein
MTMGRARSHVRGTGTGDGSSALEQGRAAHALRAWADALDSLSLADQQAPLDEEDLQRLAWSATLSGRDDEGLR